MADKLIGLVARHGQTGANKDGRFRSWIDFPLNETGLTQADAASEFLKKYKIKNVISSPLLRAFVTADTIASKHNLFVYQHRGLFPWRLGVFSGLSRDENQDALRLFVKNPLVSVPEGESLDAFQERQFQFWKFTLDEARTNDILTLFVCHTSNITALENFTQGMEDIEPEFGESVKPGGVGAITWDGEHYKVTPIFGEPEKAKFGGS